MFHVEPHGERVHVLRMDDGKVNAMGPAFVEAFPAAWREAARGDRSIVIAGNAKAFCAGLDLKTLPHLDAGGLAAFVRGFNALFHQVWTHPRPVVSAVDGPAMAGGAILALCSDTRVVGPGARLGLTEVQVGVPFPPPIVELARHTLPVNEHTPAIVQSVVRQGEECLRAGWAHHAVPKDALLPKAIALAEEAAQLDPDAYRVAKELLRAPVTASMEAFLKSGLDAYVQRLGSAQTREAIVRNFQRVTGKK